MSKPIKPVVNHVAIVADANGKPPAEIQLLHTGNWHTPWHGDFEVTGEDIRQYVEHFGQGIGLVAEEDKKLPINYGHMRGDAAAAWVTGLEAREGDSQLWATGIHWTPKATQALADGEWKYISPEFNTRSWPYEDPEVSGSRIDNVMSGAGLTNIPLFKKLKPVMASVTTGDANNNKGASMTLEELRAKKLEDLNDEEKKFLEEHKAELTEDERKTFKLEDAEEASDPKPDEKQPEVPEDQGKPNEATALKGLTPERINQLEADAKAGREARDQLARRDAEDIVKAHISAGRIKSEAKDSTVSLLLASSGEQRKNLEAHLDGLAANPVLASKISDSGSTATSASDELFKKAAEVVKASDGKTSLDEAVKTILSNDVSLRDQVNAERST